MRRGDDVYLTDVSDDELRWKVCWLPRTTEIVASADAWVDGYWHRTLFGGSPASAGQPGSDPVVAPAVIPQLICVLGVAESAEAARTLLTEASTPAACRAFLKSDAP
jgi:hypothetical protein